MFLRIGCHLKGYLGNHVPIQKREATNAGLMDAIRTPMGAVLMLVIVIIFSTLTVASAISGELTAAAVGAAGLLVIIVIIGMINMVGK
ncbi:MAG: hypothetical protein OEY88_09935 [Candidatus Bathyarchaeota archaeon]|nr:hypothetical protein [Candidatus Bathyarchaeota archaeon]